MAVGDFDADLCGDLVVGVPFEGLGMFSNPGAVHILFGDAAGLSGTGSEMWSQAYTGSPDAQENYDGFGSALAP